MKIESVEQLLQEELRDLYDAEKQLVKALPKMVKAASSEDLREALSEHLEVTKEQVRRCEQIFETLGIKPKSKPCVGMKGIVEEGREVMEEDASEEMLDAALTGAARRVEHYEIAAYGSARGLAERMGNSEVVDLLQQTLEEEEEADQKLHSIAENLLENLPETGDLMESGESEEGGEESGPGRSSGRGNSSRGRSRSSNRNSGSGRSKQSGSGGRRS